MDVLIRSAEHRVENGDENGDKFEWLMEPAVDDLGYTVELSEDIVLAVVETDDLLDGVEGVPGGVSVHP